MYSGRRNFSIVGSGLFSGSNVVVALGAVFGPGLQRTGGVFPSSPQLLMLWLFSTGEKTVNLTRKCGSCGMAMPRLAVSEALCVLCC